MNDLHVASDLPTLGDPRTELVCQACGYGVIVAVTPAHCPMCHTSSWRTARGARRAATERSFLR